MLNWETEDYKKIDLVEPTPEQLCTRTQEGCTYCKYDTPHPLTLPSDWSSKDWNRDKAKAREHCSLLDFDKLEQQLNQTLQNSVHNTLLETLHDKMPDKKLMDDFQAMSLKEGKNELKLPDK